MYSRIVLAALALAVAAIFYFSDLPFGLTSNPRVAEVALIPEGPQFADVRRYANYGAAELPYISDAERPAAADTRPPKIGWTYREASALRMPFWASGEFGYVAYVERPQGILITPIGDAQMALLEQRAGRAYSREYSFPWYRHVWGWLILVGLIAWTLIWRREANLAEEARWAE
jgi:hypothetical protein